MGTSKSLPLYPDKKHLQAWGLTPKKSLGQNFLLKPSVVTRMVHPLEDATLPIIEVGPGPGALTWALLTETTNKITSIEKDSQFQGILTHLQSFDPARFSLIQEDFFRVPLPQQDFYAVGNLPYNISTQIIFHFLAHKHPPKKMIFMVQKEVADRLTATPHTKSYGRLSVMTQWCCHISQLFDVPPDAFWPAPKITSTVVMIALHITEKHRALWSSLEYLLKGVFSQRRKMLRQSLKTVIKDPTDLLAETHIDPQARAENLSLQDFERLATALQKPL